MEQKIRLPRIKRIAIGEEILEESLPMELQLEYENYRAAEDLFLDAKDRYSQDKNQENAKDVCLKYWDCEKKKQEFWLRVFSRHNVWDKPLGIRDGYAVVIENPRHPFIEILSGGGQ